MDKCINLEAFVRALMDDEKQVKRMAEIMKGLLAAQSPRLTNIAEQMSGHSERNYKVIQRFLQQVEMKELLLRFYQEEAAFVIGEPGERGLQVERGGLRRLWIWCLAGVYELHPEPLGPKNVRLLNRYGGQQRQ